MHMKNAIPTASLGILIIVSTCIAGFLIWTHRYFFEPKPPVRSFGVNVLLITQEDIPLWDASTPFFPAGNNLCTTECIALHFGRKENYPGALATQYVFRYLTSGIAERTFEYEFSRRTGVYAPVEEWNYQIPVAQQSFFGCSDMAGHANRSCEWAGRYEEYIIVFNTILVPHEMEWTELRAIVEDIDMRTADYLDKAVPRSQ
jgi:hypothetical protein